MHKPVLLNEVLEIFNPRPAETYIDATINGGGHALAILERIRPGGELLGIDWDCELIERLKDLKFKDLKLTCANYANLGTIARKYHLETCHGILFDLGFSSYHLETSRRGFSFQRNEPLDMRYNIQENDLTAEKIINTWPGKTIENIIRTYGEERYAGKITAALVRERKGRKITTTGELADIISRVARKRGRINPATRTFQALRIAVNRELENLESGLQEAMNALKPGGKIIAISFHSLEDRLVKNFLRREAKRGTLKIIIKKPMRPSHAEVYQNPRARSAKLRAAEKL